MKWESTQKKMLDDSTGAGDTLFERVVITSPLMVSAVTPVSETITKMNQAGTSYAVVVDQQPSSGSQRPHLVGLFTERDLVRTVAQEQSFAEAAISVVMNTHVPTISVEKVTSAIDLFAYMRQQQVRYLPVIYSSGQLAGIVTKQSLRQSITAPFLLKFKSVSEVMTTQVVCVSQVASVIQAAQLMATHNISCVVVSAGGDLPVGIITERDIVQFKVLGIDMHNTCVEQVMSTPLLPVNAQDSLWAAHQQMNLHRVRRLVVCTPEGRLSGLITQDSVLQALDSQDSQQMVALLRQEVMQLRAENQSLLEARNRELERSQRELSNQLENKQLEQKKTKAQLEAAYRELEKSHSELSRSNRTLNHTLQELEGVKQELQQSNVELTNRVEHSTSDLLRAEGRWHSLLEEVHLVVIGLDDKGRVNYANPFFLRLTGYSAENVLEKSWFENFIPHDDREHTYQYFQSLITAEDIPPSYQNAILTRSGSVRVIDWSNVALRDHSDRIIGTMSIGEDITERLAVDRMKGEFVSVVSHELRTPLTAIHGSLQLIANGLVDSDSQQGKELLQIAAKSSQRLVRLVNDILELERLESGKALLNREKVFSHQLTSQVARTFKVVADRQKINIAVSDPGIELMADSDRLTQVLTNLLDNAINFSPENTTISLSVGHATSSGSWQSPSIKDNNASTPKAASALFTVKDEGRGIPSEDLSSIFRRFTQVNYADSREKGGTGLGLAICHNIVHQHGGKIWVESTLGKGSCFFFTIPLAK